jgi:hypothetical protein
MVDGVAGKLSFRNLGSYGRQLIHLSILGEMRNERALPPLQDHLNSHECPVYEERGFIQPESAAPKMSVFDACAGLKAAAINMIAYIYSPAATAMLLKTISDHPSRTVRLSAINAYLYNHGDAAQAIVTVRQYVSAGEEKFVGVPHGRSRGLPLVLSPRAGIAASRRHDVGSLRSLIKTNVVNGIGLYFHSPYQVMTEFESDVGIFGSPVFMPLAIRQEVQSVGNVHLTSNF